MTSSLKVRLHGYCACLPLPCLPMCWRCHWAFFGPSSLFVNCRKIRSVLLCCVRKWNLFCNVFLSNLFHGFDCTKWYFHLQKHLNFLSQTTIQEFVVQNILWFATNFNKVCDILNIQFTIQFWFIFFFNKFSNSFWRLFLTYMCKFIEKKC